MRAFKVAMVCVCFLAACGEGEGQIIEIEPIGPGEPFDGGVVPEPEAGSPASVGEVGWATLFGGPGDEFVSGFAVSPEGGVWLAGTTGGPFLRIGDEGLANLGGSDLFVVHLDDGGALQWLRGFGGEGDDGASDIDVDGSGNLIINGWFSSEMEVNGEVFQSIDSTDACVIKLSPSGEVLWVYHMGGPGSDWGGGLGVGPDGSVYAAFMLSGGGEVGGVAIPALPGDGMAHVMVKLSAEGELVWVRHFEGTGWGWPSAIEVDEVGNIYTTGRVSRGSKDLGDGPVGSEDGDTIFVASYTPEGEHRWSHSFGGRGGGYENGHKLHLDDRGALHVVGVFVGTIDLGTEGQPHELRFNGDQDVFVASYARDTGELLEAFAFGGPGNESADGLVVGAEGELMVGASFEGSMRVGTRRFASRGGSDMLLLGFSADGTPQEGIRFGGRGTDDAPRLGQDAKGDIYLAGSFSSKTQIEGQTFESAGLTDVLVIKISPQEGLE